MRRKYFFLFAIFLLIQIINPIFCQENISNYNVENADSKNNDISLINIISLLIGFIGTFFGIISFMAYIKDKKNNELIFEYAKRDLEIKATKENLENVKQKRDQNVAEYKVSQEELETLRKHIDKEIPIEAKNTFLKEKKRSQEELLYRDYKSLLQTEKKLKGVETESIIPPQIRYKITNEILPEYLQKEEQSKNKNYLVICTTCVSILSIFRPYFWSYYIEGLTYLFAVMCTILILRLGYLQFFTSYKNDKTKITLINFIISGILVIIFMFIFSIISPEPFLFYHYYRWEISDLAGVAFILSILLSLIITKILIMQSITLTDLIKYIKAIRKNKS